MRGEYDLVLDWNYSVLCAIDFKLGKNGVTTEKSGDDLR